MKFKIYLLILALMLCVGQDAWGEVTGTYNSSTKTLTFLGTGEVTQSIVQNIANYDQATNVLFDSGITAIGSSAFSGTGLTSVTIPSSVTSIGRLAFFECKKLATITLESASKELTIGAEAFNVNDQTGCVDLTFNCYRQFTYNTESYTITNPTTLTTTTVNPHNGLFRNANRLNKVVIGANVTSIPVETFYECSSLSLVDCTGATDLKTIGDKAFFSCSALATVQLPNQLLTIGNSAFNSCFSLTSVTIPSSVTSIGRLAFFECKKLATITLESASKELTIGAEAFGKNYQTGCVDLTFNCYRQFIYNTEPYKSGTTTTYPLDGLFRYADRLKKVVIGANVTSIPVETFYECSSLSLVDCTGATDLKTIGDKAFFSCSALATVQLPNQLLTIGNSAFNSCSSLTSVIIPSSVTSIGRLAFFECKKLATITLESASKELTIGAEAFNVNDQTGCVDLTFNCYRQFTYNTESYTITNPITLTTTTVYPLDGLFRNADRLKKVVIGANVTSIPVETFYECSSLSLVDCTGATDLKTIDDDAFFSCSALATIQLPKQLLTIGNSAFNSCSSLTSVIIPSSVTSIGRFAFLDCKKLATITLAGGSKALTIDAEAFYANDQTDCVDLTFNCYRQFTYTNPTSPYDGLFRNADRLKKVVIGTNVTSIPTETFYGCSNLPIAYILGNPSIGTDAFPSNTTLDYGETWSYDKWIAMFEKDNSYVTELRLPNDNVAGRTYTDKANLNHQFPNLTKVVLDYNVTTLGDYIFQRSSGLTNKIETLVIKGEPVAVGKYAFVYNTKLAKIEGMVRSVSTSSFLGCSGLKSIEIVEDETLEDRAFKNCSSLTSITIPETVNAIGKEVFAGCTGLTNITALNPTPVTLSDDVFDSNLYSKAELNVPFKSIEAYKSKEVWKNFYDIFTPDGVKLVDGQPYTRTVTELVPVVRYTRNFSTSSVNKWQSLCIPFSIDMVSDDYEIGEILTFCPMKDTNGDGFIDGNDDNYLVITPCKNGKTVANAPYMIKPKKSGDIVFTEENCTLHAANAGELHFATTKTSYDIYGILQKSEVATVANQYYYMTATGSLSHRTTGSTTIKPNRWYLTMSKKTYGSDEVDDMSSNAREIQIFTIGEDMDEATAIGIIEAGTGHKSEKASDNSVYTLSGMKVDNMDNLPAGIYVKNGKKFVVK